MRLASATRRSARWCARRITRTSRPRICCGPYNPQPPFIPGVAMHSPSLRPLAARFVASLAVAAILATPTRAAAEASVVRISYGYGILYLPLMVMDREHLLEKHAKAL